MYPCISVYQYKTLQLGSAVKKAWTPQSAKIVCCSTFSFYKAHIYRPFINYSRAHLQRTTYNTKSVYYNVSLYRNYTNTNLSIQEYKIFF